MKKLLMLLMIGIVGMSLASEPETKRQRKQIRIVDVNTEWDAKEINTTEEGKPASQSHQQQEHTSHVTPTEQSLLQEPTKTISGKPLDPKIMIKTPIITPAIKETFFKSK